MRKRSISIPLRVTEAERTAIDKKAEKAGMNRTDYLITCAMGKRITVIDDLTPLLAELRRIGNNLNQLRGWRTWAKLRRFRSQKRMRFYKRPMKNSDNLLGKEQKIGNANEN